MSREDKIAELLRRHELMLSNDSVEDLLHFISDVRENGHVGFKEYSDRELDNALTDTNIWKGDNNNA